MKEVTSIHLERLTVVFGSIVTPAMVNTRFSYLENQWSKEILLRVEKQVLEWKGPIQYITTYAKEPCNVWEFIKYKLGLKYKSIDKEIVISIRKNHIYPFKPIGDPTMFTRIECVED